MPTCSRCHSPIAETDRFCSSCGAPSGDVFGASAAQTLPSPAGARPPSRPPSDPSSLGHGRFEPGTRLGTRYRVVGLLGRGGMGEVYRADDLELGASVALKLLPERLRHDAEALARFRAEVRLARQVAHPNITRVYDIGEADGHVFLTMEYVDGEDLASVLRRMGRPSRDKAVEIARQLCMGLAAAHERGVLHRDLKPSNIMIDGRGRVRIMDFGLAALADEAAGDQPVVGTPAYMAPEQLATGQVSVQSDLYALGLVIYELFTGRRVHDTTDPAELRRRHAAGSIPTPSSVVDDMDPVIERLVLRCLEADPRLRPPSAYAVLGALPGGDPLAAALAAGETPSPDLVANAGEGGGLAPRAAVGLLLATLAATLLALWLNAPVFVPFTASPEAQSYRAASILESLGYAPLPGHSAAGLGARGEWADRLARRYLPNDSLAGAGPGAVFFWRRFEPRRLIPVNVHTNVVLLTDPPQSAPGSVAILLGNDGRLVGLQAIARTDSAAAPPRDTVAKPLWAPLLAAAGLDPARLAPEPRTWAAPVPADTSAAWITPWPHAPGGIAHVRAGAYRGRPTYFALVDSLGSATAAIQPGRSSGAWAFGDWSAFLVWTVMLLVAEVLARRNLKLGRGDRRGAWRLAAFVGIATAVETVFTWSIPENGAPGLVDSLTNDRALGHASIHALQMWLAYVAIEPYVRRVWPRMLVSWARLASGRWRDPMVGRDALAGVLLGALGSTAIQVGYVLLVKLRAPVTLNILGPTTMAAYAGLGGMGYLIAFYTSVTVLAVLSTLVMCLFGHLLTRRDWATIAFALVLSSLGFTGSGINLQDATTALVAVVSSAVTVVALFRLGLLSALVATFATLLLPLAPPALDVAAWYSGRGLLLVGPLVALALYGFWTALAGRPLFGDPLQAEKRPAKA